jgi:hypothetical protein
MKKTRPPNAGVPQRRPPRPSSLATYSVGYSKPPREHRFQPGRSGNPKGRPKGVKNTVILLREMLDRKVEMRSGGILRKVSMREAMLMRFTESALKGDIKAAGFLLQRYDMGEAGDDYAMNVVMQDEQEIIDKFLQRLAKGKGEQE